MAITKINYSSDFGLHIDNGWVKYAKGYKPDFNIVKGYSYDVTLDSNGLIVGVSKISPLPKGRQTTSSSTFKTDSRQRDILRGQCLKIASDFWLGKTSFDMDKKEDREKIYSSTACLLKELELIKFLEW